MTLQEIEQVTEWIRKNNAKPVDRRLLDTLGLSRARISQLTRSGDIDSRRIERTVYIPTAAIARLKKHSGRGRPRGGRTQK